MEQDPAANSVTELPETLQTEVVVELKPTDKPELAAALKGATPTAWGVGKAPKLIVCAARTLKVCVTDGAAE